MITKKIHPPLIVYFTSPGGETSITLGRNVKGANSPGGETSRGRTDEGAKRPVTPKTNQLIRQSDCETVRQQTKNCRSPRARVDGKSRSALFKYFKACSVSPNFKHFSASLIHRLLSSLLPSILQSHRIDNNSSLTLN